GVRGAVGGLARRAPHHRRRPVRAGRAGGPVRGGRGGRFVRAAGGRGTGGRPVPEHARLGRAAVRGVRPVGVRAGAGVPVPVGDAHARPVRAGGRAGGVG